MFEAYKTIKALVSDRRGITAMEYAVVAGAILAVALTAFNALGTKLTSIMGTITL
ncbi:MAG: Flp family type IVb pilin [Acetobacteraceae bacterium]|nr:Flp family type IVb pilin [Acetobacteraceae bacterium]